MCADCLGGKSPVYGHINSEKNVKKAEDVAKDMGSKIKDKAKEFVKKVKGTCTFSRFKFFRFNFIRNRSYIILQSV